MFDATLLDSSPARTPVLTLRHWEAALLVAVLGWVAGYFVLPLLTVTTPKSRIVESVLLGVGLMFYELMIFYVLADARRLGFSVGTWSTILLALNVVGFVAYLIYAAIKTGDWKRAALPLAYILEGTIVCVLLLVPLVHMEALPNLRWITTPVPPPPPPGPPAARTAHVRTIRRPAPPSTSTITVPSVIPTHIAIIRDEPPEPPAIGPGNWVPGGLDLPGGRRRDGVLNSVLRDTSVPPPPPLPARQPATRRIHISVIEQAKLLFHPDPEYPPLAKMARIQGTVRMEAVISKDGTIQDLKALSGHPLLVRAAMDAVARWRYQPTLLNGEPVEVVTEVEVKFILDE